MTDLIHASAIIHPGAEIAPGVQIGPFCVVEEEAHIGVNSVLHAGVTIQKYTTIGQECVIHGGAILGGPPQDTKFKGEKSFLEIGDHNVIREFVTIHRASGEGETTRVGDRNMFMAYAHIGHNCEIGSGITIASYAGISGHVTIDDSANISGVVGIHQFCRIGTLAMIGGVSGVVKDIPPYMIANGQRAEVIDININGLKRAGVSPKVRGELRIAFKMLHRAGLNQSQALEAILNEIPTSPELEVLLNFIRQSREGFNGRAKNPPPK